MKLAPFYKHNVPKFSRHQKKKLRNMLNRGFTPRQIVAKANEKVKEYEVVMKFNKSAIDKACWKANISPLDFIEAKLKNFIQIYYENFYYGIEHGIDYFSRESPHYKFYIFRRHTVKQFPYYTKDEILVCREITRPLKAADLKHL